MLNTMHQKWTSRRVGCSLDAVRRLTVWEETDIKGSAQRKTLAIQDLSVQGQRIPRDQQRHGGLLRRTTPEHQKGLKQGFAYRRRGRTLNLYKWTKMFP